MQESKITPERKRPQIVGRFAPKQQHKRNRDRPKPGKVKQVQVTTDRRGQEVSRRIWKRGVLVLISVRISSGEFLQASKSRKAIFFSEPTPFGKAV